MWEIERRKVKKVFLDASLGKFIEYWEEEKIESDFDFMEKQGQQYCCPLSDEVKEAFKI